MTGSLDGLGPRPWLVLGGGGLRGLAHVGAWGVLRDAGVRLEGVVGTSIGGLVAVALAGGRTVEEMAERARRLERRDILRVDRGAVWVNGIREGSVFRGDVLRGYLEELLDGIEWDGLSLPVQVNAVDLATGLTEWMGVGAREDVAVLDAVYASASLPVLFPPGRIGDRWFVDGGVREALALERAQTAGATGILAIDVGSGGPVDADSVVERGLVAVHQRVFSIMAEARRHEVVSDWAGVPLVYVRPELDGFDSFDFEAIPYFLEEGARAMRDTLTGSPAL